MEQAHIRFHGELNDFLPEEQRSGAIAYSLEGTVSIKHVVEALGVPHTEIELLLVNRVPVTFAYLLRAGDQVDVYPESVRPGVRAAFCLRPPLPRPVRFILDTHLGQLASYLRLLGFDSLYRNDYDDATLAQIASRENRVLLTRDRGVLKRKIVLYGYCLRQTEPQAQLLAVLRRYRLAGEIRPWRRCLRCNGLLAPVPKATILAELEPKTRRYYQEFQRCQACGQIYWQGSHYARLQHFIDRILAAVHR